jgi:hypothetical protein
MPVQASFEFTSDNIRHLIDNQRASYQPHAFRSAGRGNGDFNSLFPILRALRKSALKPYIDQIDSVRMTHLEYQPCFFKAMVYSIFFT